MRRRSAHSLHVSSVSMSSLACVSFLLTRTRLGRKPSQRAEAPLELASRAALAVSSVRAGHAGLACGDGSVGTARADQLHFAASTVTLDVFWFVTHSQPISSGLALTGAHAPKFLVRVAVVVL